MNSKAQESVVARIPSWLLPSVVLLLAILGIVLRKPDSFTRAQFWAEDGLIFFKDAVEQGGNSLFTPYAGYYLLVPRLLALSYRFVDWQFAPLVYNILAVGVYAAFVLFLFRGRVKIPYRWALALLPVVGPVGMEVHATVTNTQWIMALILAVLLFSESGQTVKERMFDLLVLILCGFTGPFLVLFSPVVFLRWWDRRDRSSGQLLLASAVVVAIQTRSLLLAPATPNSSVAPFSDPEFFRFFIKSVAHFFAYPIPFDYHYTGGLTGAELGIFFSGSAAVLVAAWLALKNRKWGSFFLLGGAVMLLFITLGLRNHPRQVQFGYTRYFFLPKVFLLWSLFLLAERRAVFACTFATLLPLLFFLNTDAFVSTPLPNKRWRKHARCLERKPECVLPINPRGWKVLIRQQAPSLRQPG